MSWSSESRTFDHVRATNMHYTNYKMLHFLSLGVGRVFLRFISGTWVLTRCVQLSRSLHCYFCITVRFPRAVKCVASSVSVALIVHDFCELPTGTISRFNAIVTFQKGRRKRTNCVCVCERKCTRMRIKGCPVKGEAPAHMTLIGCIITAG
jgi:hypothetical protein